MSPPLKSRVELPNHLSGSGRANVKRLIRGIDVLLTTIIAALTLHVLIVLFTGGYRFRGLGIRLTGLRVNPPIMLLVALLVLHFLLRRETGFREFFASHKAVILFSFLLIVYLANGKTLGSGDTLPARYLPLSILHHGNFYLDEYLAPLTLNLPYLPYYLRLVNGHYVSDFPVGAAIPALPFYAPIATRGGIPSSDFLAQLEKLSAAVMVALSAVILYFVLCSLASPEFSLIITAIYALATSSLSVSSQGLWQHGPSQLAVAAALYCLLRGGNQHRLVPFAGFLLAYAVITRPTDLLIAFSLGAYVIIYRRRHVIGFALTGLLPICFNLWYNARHFRDPFRSQFPLFENYLWQTPFWTGLAGILVSPSRGLFIYSPVLLLSFIGAGLAWKRHGDPLLRYLSIGVFLEILIYAKHSPWWGGGTYGPRLLVDIAPVLALFFCPLEDWFIRRRALKIVFVVLALWSIGAHSIGAFSDHWPWNLDGGIDWLPERRWSWTDNQLVFRPRGVLNSAIIAVRHLPTSRTHPELLSASYRSDLPSMLKMAAGEPVKFSVDAENRGKAVWLAWAKDDEGAVRLGWRWLRDNETTPKMEWRVPLGLDVFPGQRYTFRAYIDSPREPGTYIFEVGLVSEQRAWFSELGQPSIRSIVTLDPHPP
jgi:hypothetical protein